MRKRWAWYTIFEMNFIFYGNKGLFMSNLVSLALVITEISKFKQIGTAQSTRLVILIKNVYKLWLLHTFCPKLVYLYFLFQTLKGHTNCRKMESENGNSPQLFRALRRALSKHYPIIMAAALMISYSLFSSLLLLLLIVEHSTHWIIFLLLLYSLNFLLPLLLFVVYFNC